MDADPGPLFPDAIGGILHAVLNPEPAPGPPHTHTLNLPPTEYNEDGEPLPSRIEPTVTITRIVQDEGIANAYNAAGRWLYGTDMHSLLRDHGIDRCLTWGPSRLRNGIRRGPPAAYRRGAAPGA